MSSNGTKLKINKLIYVDKNIFWGVTVDPISILQPSQIPKITL
jgi:hypothetical protein